MEIKPNKIQYMLKKASLEVINKILDAIAQGSPNKHAAESNGISERSFYLWLEQGICDLEHEQDSVFSYMVQSLRKIEQNEITYCRQAIKEQKKGHKGAQWTLEHVYWRHFGASVADLEFNERLTELENKIRTGGPTHGETNSSQTQQNPQE